MLKKILSFNEMRNGLSLVKKADRSALSNILPVESIYTKVLKEGRLYGTQTEDLFLALEDKGEFFLVHFAVVPGVDLIEKLNLLKNSEGISKPLVVEHVIREGKDLTIGVPNSVLRRMVHTGEFPNSLTETHESALGDGWSVEKASNENIPALKEIFKQHFNILTERIPNDDELASLIERNGIFVAHRGSEIGGFVIFEREGLNLHLRYWWVSPLLRGKGVGSSLMSQYFKASEGTRRQFLWVFSDNENAIKRYQHFGFDFDGTSDNLYILH